MDDIEKRMEEIRRLWGFGTVPAFQKETLIRMLEAAMADIDWLLTQLEASRQECERLRAALMDARRDEGYP